MAKQKSPAQSPKSTSAEPLKAQTYQKTKSAYRIEKLSQFEFQAYRAVINDDGSITEEPFGKPSLANLVMARIYEAMGKEAKEAFNANKVQK